MCGAVVKRREVVHRDRIARSPMHVYACVCVYVCVGEYHLTTRLGAANPTQTQTTRGSSSESFLGIIPNKCNDGKAAVAAHERALKAPRSSTAALAAASASTLECFHEGKQVFNSCTSSCFSFYIGMLSRGKAGFQQLH
eukprot:GHVU01164738.1.p2 GENE.GHVU01164738.1~~GHVU01164738.1.p2  ORF type:complete len:139 (+),score=12.50 GHVU01164738.1:1378-1794(+)